MYPDNNWYSHRKVLAEYCGLSDRNLLGSIQHGWVNPLNFKSFLIKRKFNLFCWTDTLSKYCINHGYGKIIPIGAPFLYLYKSEINKINFKGKGTIVFPSHSNLEDYQKVNHKGLIDIIEKKFEGPYKVHLYYTDFTETNCRDYKDKGWEIISSETRSSKNFLNRLFKNLINAENVVSTDISSVFFYALYLEKKISLITKDENNKNLNMIYRDQMYDFTENFMKINSRLFEGKMSKDEQKEIARNELGENFILQPENLKKILGFGNPLKDLSSKMLSKIIEIKQGKALKDGAL